MATATVVMAMDYPAPSPASSAAGLLALLEEDDEVLRVHALQQLHAVVDQYWAEVSSALPLIEEMSEDDSFGARELAAAVASKVFFHLEEYNDALRLALGAGKYFDVSSKSEYVGTMVSRCIDEYTALRVAAAAAKAAQAEGGGDAAVGLGAGAGGSAEVAPMDPRMEDVVEKMFERCYADGEYTQAMGIALEALRLDRVEQTLGVPADPAVRAELLAYTFHVCQTLVASKRTRDKVLRILVQGHRVQPTIDHLAVCSCLHFLNESRLVVEILLGLLRGSEEDALLAYQIVFDLNESGNQKFILDVSGALPVKAQKGAAAAAAAVDADGGGAEEKKDGEEKVAGEGEGEGDAMVVEAPAAAAAAAVEADGEADRDGPQETEEFWGRIGKLRQVLVGGFADDLVLSFLHGACQTDLLILNNIKTAIESRNSVLHNATVVCHAFMNAGTTRDGFLRDNLDWMGRASNWAKFTATASIGVVHKGHVRESMNLLQPYLPSGGVSASPFSEGGALYALGLIHANRGGQTTAAAAGGGAAGGAAAAAAEGEGVVGYLSGALRDAGTNEAVQHGACLGLGLAAMATNNATIYEAMKNTLYQDSAVSGEAAAIGIGLVVLGGGTSTEQGQTAMKEMVAYAHETSHEKIIRGLVIGIALGMYGQEEAAEGMIEQLSRDRDPILRYGAMYTIGLAYCGTGNNRAVRRLLHVAVSDVSDDVRLAAVTNLGFIMFRTPDQVPRLLSLLAESFNAHVRYGSCMAIGIACAGTSSKEALEVLEPMAEDAVDFVRQGAMIAIAMVILQQSDTVIGPNGQRTASKAKLFRARLATIVGDKHQSTMAKMGAILAAGILEAGGRNVTITMLSSAGYVKMGAVVGLALFCQYWYWYPLLHGLSLALSPTMLAGLNKDLKLPKSFKATCTARPSQFAYPRKLEEKKEEKKERVTTVTLSTTAKAKAREARKELAKAKEGGAAGVAESKASDEPAAATTSKPTGGAAEMDVSEGAGEAEAKAEGKEEGKEEVEGAKEESKKKREVEPESFQLSNPDRVTPLQQKFIHFDPEQRYVAVRPGAEKRVGIVMLRDKTPTERDEEAAAVVVPGVAGEEEDAEPPEPFEWSPEE